MAYKKFIIQTCFKRLSVYLLEDGDGKRGRLAGTRLGLCDDVMALDAGHDGALLDGRRLFKAIGVNAAQQLLLKVHVIEVVDHLLPVRLDGAIGVHSGRPLVGLAVLLLRCRPIFILTPLFISTKHSLC